jgi:hypothetical protein
VNHVSTGRLAAAVCLVLLIASGGRAESPLESRPLFDGRSFTGWNGDTERVWRIEAGAIVAGDPDRPAARNEFLATDCEFEDFELRYECRIDGVEKPNAGVQFRSQRLADRHEVVGYQADIGPGITGALYDESRRRKYLMTPAESVERAAVSRARNGWNACVVRCEGPRIRITVNGVETVDYVEPDPEISRRGMIALQIHGNMVGTIRYRNIVVSELTDRNAARETTE